MVQEQSQLPLRVCVSTITNIFPNIFNFWQNIFRIYRQFSSLKVIYISLYFAANIYKMLAIKIDELGKLKNRHFIVRVFPIFELLINHYRQWSSCIQSDYSDILSFSFIFCKNHWWTILHWFTFLMPRMRSLKLNLVP